MMNYKEWKLITESFFGGQVLGLGVQRPNVIGGILGSQFNEDDFEEDDDDLENDDDLDDEGDDLDDGSDEVQDDFPPDDSEELDGLPTPDEEMLDGEEEDFGIDSIGSAEDEPDDSFEGDLEKAISGPPKLPAPKGNDDFLDDIDTDLLGGEFSGDEAEMGGIPCPDCNPDGVEEGDPECPTCNGSGFADEAGGLDDVDGDPDKDKDTMDLMAMMASYMGKYMKKEASEYKDVLKKGQKSKSKKSDRKHCHCESDDFLSAISNQAKGNVYQKNSSGFSEDALLSAIDPNYDPEDQYRPGEVGFAPQGRVGVSGAGGYTQDDIAEIPTLSESAKIPTLTQWMAKYGKKSKKR